MLDLLKKAGFIELAFGIEFLENESFKQYNKKCTYDDVVKAVKNVQKHGLNARGLFIVGADKHTKGIGQKIVDFVHNNHIHGILIQSMYFVPSTPAYEKSKNKLIHENWEKYTGNVVHYPANISPYDLQQEIIFAITKIYSIKRLLHALLHEKWYYKILFVGEFFWQRSIRSNLKRELPFLKSLE
jgi:radical SAM superfamily enzyme